jgi:hypothetical protein
VWPQLVVPKPKPEPDADTFYSDSDAEYDEGYFGSDLLAGSGDGAGGSGGGYARQPSRQHRYGPAHHLHREARPAPAPTECHALGSLHNASYSLIKARATPMPLRFLRCAFRAMCTSSSSSAVSDMPRRPATRVCPRVCVFVPIAAGAA